MTYQRKLEIMINDSQTKQTFRLDTTFSPTSVGADEVRKIAHEKLDIILDKIFGKNREDLVEEH